MLSVNRSHRVLDRIVREALAAARIRGGGAGRNAGRGATATVAPPPREKLQNVARLHHAA